MITHSYVVLLAQAELNRAINIFSPAILLNKEKDDLFYSFGTTAALER